MAKKKNNSSQHYTYKTRDRKNVKSQRRAPKESALRPYEDANGIVLEIFQSQVRVRRIDHPTEKDFLCFYRRGILTQTSSTGFRERTPLCVGDRVVLEGNGEQAVVVARCERRNFLARQAPGKEGKQVHLLAANVDRVVIVASAGEPAFSPGLVDRFLVACQAQEIPTLLVVNKMDLHSGNFASAGSWKFYEENLEIPVFPVSVKDGEGVEQLKEAIDGLEVVFCGHSGVGKTSLLHHIFDRKVGRVGTVSSQTGKGRHTTTGAVMVGTLRGTTIIDTPGIRSFMPVGISADRLIEFFPDLSAEGLENEGAFRHNSYQNLLESIQGGDG